MFECLTAQKCIIYVLEYHLALHCATPHIMVEQLNDTECTLHSL
jgi:hypothetical protein